MIRSWKRLFESGGAVDGGGCGFLDAAEIDAGMSGTLASVRVAAFESHQLAGCSACALFWADLQVFRAVASRGLLPSERRGYERTRPMLAARLRQELAARPVGQSPWATWLSWRPLAGAAAAAVLLALVALPVWRRGDPEGAILLPSGAVVRVEPLPFSAPPTVRDAQTQRELWREAEAAYASGDYARAATVFGQLIERQPSDHDATLYRGVAMLMLGRHDEATAVLDHARHLAEAQGFTGTTDEYYLGLAALGRGSQSEARRYLERARSAGGVYGNRAAELLERMQREP